MNWYTMTALISREQDCRQCGKCCEKWGWDQKGIVEDLIPWISNHRRDILQHVFVQFSGGERACGNDISLDDLPRVEKIYFWIGPSGEVIRYCPFFRRAEDGKVYCRIHDTKPAVCVGFAPWKEIWHDYGLNCPACRDTMP